jgi:N-acetyl sugar amidotransferase
VNPEISAVPVVIDDDGICSACRLHEQIVGIDWESRWSYLNELMDHYCSNTNYDVIIPVNGSLDCYYQVHVATKELKLKPLLVTYDSNNYLPEGEVNLRRMREIFDCDHIIVHPGIETLKKMNRLGLKVQGDNNWHTDCGITTVPIQVAVRYKVPLIFWGQHNFMEMGGMYSYNDFVEFTAKHRKEHSLRGYDWHDFTDAGLEKLGLAEMKEGLSAKDLLWAQYPDDDEIDEVGVRGIYLCNFRKWDAQAHLKVVTEEYGWKSAEQPSERTYRMMSKLDDMHENGIHDYMKFIKLGYGRGTDHACKDIRSGKMTRAEGIEAVRKYDAVKPYRDLKRYLEYVDMTEEEFDHIADGFRDPRVWRVENDKWVKDNVWGEPSSYGPVHRHPEQAKK